MSSGQEQKEFSLLEILNTKQYPQVFRVTRPYCANQRECLKKGQIITVLDRRKVNLVVGVDHECREFYVRKDRSTNVEVVEEERVAYNLSVIVPLAKLIEGIEFRKEVRFEKQIFGVGERFTIEKVHKSFRGRSKNLALRRQLDNKVYRFPLDMIGNFKLLAGKSVLPLSKILSLRVPPITVQFHNTPTSSNYPRGKVTLREIIACDIVYVLTVRSEVYTYEAFLADPNIHVEKCRLKLPMPIVKIIPNGLLVNSPDYINPIKGNYRHKISEIESNLVEDIYALTYYGSATFDKPVDDDTHLITGSRFPPGSLPLSDEKVETASLSSNAPSTPDSDQIPLPKPRYSKKPRQRVPQSFPAILESDQSQSSRNLQVDQDTTDEAKKKISLDELKSAISNIDFSEQQMPRSFKSWDAVYNNSPGHGNSPKNSRIRLSTKSTSCINITTMNWQSDPVSVFYNPPSEHTPVAEEELADNITNSCRGSSDTASTGRNSPSSRRDSYVTNSTGRNSPASLSSGRQSPSGLSIGHKSSEHLSHDHRSSGRHSPSQLSAERNLPAHAHSIYRSQSPGRHSPRVYDTVSSYRSHVNSWSSGMVTEDSGDSGVILQFNSTRYSSPSTSQLSSPTSDANPLYATLGRGDFDGLPPPLPARDATYQNIHHLQVDIDIGDRAGESKDESPDENYSDVAVLRPSLHSDESLYENIDKEEFPRSTSIGRPSFQPPLSHSQSVIPNLPKCRTPSTASNPIRHRGADEIASMSQTDVGRLLVDLKLESYVESFALELINGKLLKELDENTLINDLRMSTVQAHKMYKYVHGWRPILRDPRSDEHEMLPPQLTMWSVNNVFTELQKINLGKLAHFCKANLIDGPLLVDLVENDFLGSLKNDHNISLSGIELSRLKAFVLKEWRPDCESVTTTTDLDELYDKAKNVVPGKKYKQLWNRLTVSANNS